MLKTIQILKLLGAFPCTYVGNSYRLSWLGLIYSGIIVFWLFFDASSFVLSQHGAFHMQLYLIFFEKVSSLFTNLLATVLNIYNKDKLNSVHSRLQLTDRIMLKIGLRHRQTESMVIFTLSVPLIMFARFSGESFSRAASKMSSEFITSALVLGRALRIHYDVSCITSRLVTLNRALVSIKMREQKGDVHKLRILCQCHKILCRASETTNESFSAQSFLITVFAAMMIISKASTLTERMIYRRLMRTLAAIAVLILGVVYLSIVVISCTSAKKESEKFNALLYQIMTFSSDRQIRDDHTLKVHFLGRWSAVFSAGGFFTIDYSLFTIVNETIITYIVVLMQFGKLDSGFSPPDDF